MTELHKWLVEAKDDTVLLTEIAKSSNQERLVDQILTLIESDAETHLPGTWILKYLVESGQDLTSQQAKRLVDTLDSLNGWQSKLHVLQLSSNSKTLKPETIANWAKDHLSEENKFLRAWAIYVSVLGFAENDPNLAQQILNEGLQSDSGSIRSRAKKAAEQLRKLNAG